MQLNPQNNKQSLLKILQTCLTGINPQYVFQLSSKIYPVMTSHIDCNQALFGSLQQYIKSTKGKNLSTKTIQNYIYLLAEQLNPELLQAIKQIIKTNFFDKIDKFIFKDKIQAKKSPLLTINNNKFQQNQQQLGQVKLNQFQPYLQKHLSNLGPSIYSSKQYNEKLTANQLAESKDQQFTLNSKDKKQFFHKQQIKDKNQKIKSQIVLENVANPLTSARSVFGSGYQIQGNLQKLIKKPQVKSQKSNMIQKYVLDNSKIYNFAQQTSHVCICGKQCKDIILNQNAFKCVHCNCNYHTSCMKKQRQSKNCLFCNLKLIIPTKKVQKTLFQGILKKNKRKHQIPFNLTLQDIALLRNWQQYGFRITIRCFRLKQNTQSFILFPDSAYITLNSKELKQFRPLHRQSSLKYRKDQPINLIKNYSEKNKIIITQTPAPSTSSDRVQFEDHFFGVYIIQQMSIQKTIKATIKSQINSFNQSLVLLQNAFGLGLITQDVSCQVVKIPLVCALTTEKITYPIRGLFCRHYQCFDLKNYLMMISTSTNPRWVCPLCKAPCYKFVYDCIISQILKIYSESGPKQVMFYKTGQFKVFNFKQQPIKNKIQNIYDLQIQSRFKRFSQNQDQENSNNKKKKVKFQIPEGQQVIDLLSD